MQRARQPADPTFTIGSSPPHRADGSSHAERLRGRSAQKGLFRPWITPTPNAPATPPPTPRLTQTRLTARPPTRSPAPDGGEDLAVAKIVGGADRVPADSPTRSTRSTRSTVTATSATATTETTETTETIRTTSSCPSRCGKGVPRSRPPKRRWFASPESATPCRCPPRRLLAWCPPGRQEATTTADRAVMSGVSVAARAPSPARVRAPATGPHSNPTSRQAVERRRAVAVAVEARLARTEPNSTQQRSSNVAVENATASPSGGTSWRCRSETG